MTYHGSKKQKDEQTKNEKKNVPVDEINETIDLGDDVKNEAKPNETKEHKKEVDKSKFVAIHNNLWKLTGLKTQMVSVQLKDFKKKF